MRTWVLPFSIVALVSGMLVLGLSGIADISAKTGWSLYGTALLVYAVFLALGLRLLAV